jgi:hypothetical protein
MKMKKFKKAALTVGLMGLLACGCAAKKVDTTEVPKSPEDQEVKVVATPTAAPAPLKYVVRKGDTLWAISHQSGIYSDSFEWPLIFKTNRDGIQDPDEIEVGEVLTIQQDPSADQVKRARQLASDTPPFKPHAAPRKPLPIDYF